MRKPRTIAPPPKAARRPQKVTIDLSRLVTAEDQEAEAEETASGNRGAAYRTDSDPLGMKFLVALAGRDEFKAMPEAIAYLEARAAIYTTQVKKAVAKKAATKKAAKKK